jgi:8-oxo-dGTP pyrophosphatase MutT (NUDIX family)
MIPNKACPVVWRACARGLEVLAFEHPLAGLQLVKGSIEPGETPQAAALRELEEESGIAQAVAVRHLGLWPSGHEAQVWSFHEVSVEPVLPRTWLHHTADDGGQVFRFFWQPLSELVSTQWHPVFAGALGFMRHHLALPG